MRKKFFSFPFEITFALNTRHLTLAFSQRNIKNKRKKMKPKSRNINQNIHTQNIPGINIKHR